MSLDSKFKELTRYVIYQREGEYTQDQSHERDKLLSDSARRGWSIPPGYVHGAFNSMQIELVCKKADIVWGALQESLDAFKPRYYQELASEIYCFCLEFFPESLCEPHNELQSMGMSHPNQEKSNKQLIGRLENARHSALHELKTKIELYTTNLQSEQPELSQLKITAQTSNLPEKIMILFIASNPSDQSTLRLDEEIRSITSKIRDSEYRDAIELKSAWVEMGTDLFSPIRHYLSQRSSLYPRYECSPSLLIPRQKPPEK